MGFRALSLLLPFSCAPAGSFFLPPTCQLSSASRGQQTRRGGNFNRGAATSGAQQPASATWARRARGPGVSMVLSSTSSKSRSSSIALGSQTKQASASAEGIVISVSEEPAEPEELPEFISHDAVSYWVHPGKESNIWLVGTIHRTAPSVKLVQEVIRGIKPEVVMVELDSERICLLPPGEAMATRNGLWWWSPEEQPEDADEQAEDDEDGEDGEDAQDTNEITVAVREAGACGARVLLGDRDFQQTATMLEKAKRVDMANAKERESFNKMTASFDCEESTREVTRKECEQMKATAPKVFAVMCTQRDQVMAKHLMKLRGSQTTVAAFGMAHLDGVEKALKGHGWKRQRA